MIQMCPAASLTYEIAESDIMDVPPRVPIRDKLVSFQLMLYSYIQAGFLETGICYFVLFQVYKSYGLSAEDFGSSNYNYFSSTVEDTYTSKDGTEYSADDQKRILAVSQGVLYNIK